jgi:hypothetical protein
LDVLAEQRTRYLDATHRTALSLVVGDELRGIVKMCFFEHQLEQIDPTKPQEHNTKDITFASTTF